MGAAGRRRLVEMDVQCERCKTEYEFDDALVSGRGTTVRCTNCGHQFKVRRGDANGASDEWVVTTVAGQRLTFGSLRDLQRAILGKQVARGDVLFRGGAPSRPLGSIAELEPFFQGRTSSRPPPSQIPSMPARAPSMPGDPTASFGLPRRSPAWQADAPPQVPQVPPAPRSPSIPVVVPGRRAESFAPALEPPRQKMDTLRPPLTGTAAPPQAAPMPPPIVAGAAYARRPPPIARLDTADYTDEPEPSTRKHPPPPPPMMPDASSPLPPPTRPRRRSSPSIPEMRGTFPSTDDPYSMAPRRRVGGWVVAFVLVLAVGVVGWVVAKPYLVGRTAGAAAQLDPRAQSFVADGERALTDGNLDMAKEDFDKASALAEGDPRLLLDQARLASMQADIPWLKLRLLPADAVDEVRTTRAQLDERVARARRAADDALAVAPVDPAATRSKIDALRLAGDRDSARSLVAKVIAQASQPETAYVLAALDLAEPEPLWTTVIERLRAAASGEGNAGRARAALVYALAKSGDVPGAKAELVRLDVLPRPYPLLPNLHVLVDKASPSAVLDAGVAATAASRPEPAAAGAAAAPAPAAAAAGNPAAGGEGVPNDSRGGMQAAAQAIKKGDWNRARAIYEAIVARNPSDSEALCGLGDVARAGGDLSGAIAAYQRAIAVNPSYLPAMLGVADTRWATGDRAGALRGYKEIVDRFPEGTYPAYVKQRAEGASGAPATGANGGPSAAAKGSDESSP
jgi:predicted Zn finger-like uncharacterized protein